MAFNNNLDRLIFIKTVRLLDVSLFALVPPFARRARAYSLCVLIS